MVKLLLAKGAYVDLEAHCGTPLHVAATKDHDGAMKILLDHNADVNKMVNGKTPMIAAIDAGSRKCILLLYKAGADRKEALTYAAEHLHAENVVSSDFVKCILDDFNTKRIIPGEPVVKRETRDGGFKAIANYAFKNKDFESAERYYTLMIALDPDDAIAFSNRSACWLLMGDGGKALSDADECRKRRPDWPKACYRQGSALMLLKDYKRAYERFSDGLEMDPENAEMEDAQRKASEALQESIRVPEVVWRPQA
ncbi:uncharacterized protein [Lolium perenne]|uniref:uncharacterized protein n=1 Tax=Lolium perenne TaxID=4522 RepID=UPI003A9A2A51